MTSQLIFPLISIVFNVKTCEPKIWSTNWIPISRSLAAWKIYWSTEYFCIRSVPVSIAYRLPFSAFVNFSTSSYLIILIFLIKSNHLSIWYSKSSFSNCAIQRILFACVKISFSWMRLWIDFTTFFWSWFTTCLMHNWCRFFRRFQALNAWLIFWISITTQFAPWR